MGERLATWARRAVTVPLYGLALALSLAALPLVLPLAAAVDVLRGSPFGLARSLLFFTFYLACEVTGIAVCFALWAAWRLTGASRERFLSWNFRLQCAWARSLLRGAARLFSLRLQVEGDADLGRGPIFLFVRHASVGDTVLPATFLADRHGWRLRYVLKRELLWDPCLDICGNRLPNYFVRRFSEDSAAEAAAVGRLAAGLGPGEGVLIYPEGTRFSPAKRARVLARLEERADPELAARARALEHVLPPRLGGPLALLAADPGADAVICAHSGFEAATRFSELLAGSLVGRSIYVAFWRVPAAERPTDPEAQVAWLFDQWSRVDAWVAAQKRADAMA